MAIQLLSALAATFSPPSPSSSFSTIPPSSEKNRHCQPIIPTSTTSAIATAITASGASPPPHHHNTQHPKRVFLFSSLCVLFSSTSNNNSLPVQTHNNNQNNNNNVPSSHKKINMSQQDDHNMMTSALSSSSSSSSSEGHLHATSYRQQSHQHQHQQQQQQLQPPAAAMSVAFSLFLLGRSGGRDADYVAARPARVLPIQMDLGHEDGVQIVDISPLALPPSSSSSSHTTTTTTTATANDNNKNNTVQTLRKPNSGGGGDSSLSPSPSLPPSPSATSVMSKHQLHTRAQIQSHLSLASDLRTCRRHITIVTTAAIPWMTGTSVNPTLRAIYLAKDGHAVTLVVPWLCSIDEQRLIFSQGMTFTSRDEQAAYIRSWAYRQILPDDNNDSQPQSQVDKNNIDIQVRFYSAVYSHQFGSILPVGAITDVFDDEYDKDVCILEEPEHLTWHHDGEVWTEIFPFVVGIIHTNYIEYAKNFGFFGPHRALALMFLNSWVCRAHCHRIIKLSDAVQQFPNSITSNVHGVRDEFILIGLRHARQHHAAITTAVAENGNGNDARASNNSTMSSPFTKGAYYLGKVVWAKGYASLLELIDDYYERRSKKKTNDNDNSNDSDNDDDDNDNRAIHIDLYGSGADSTALSDQLLTKASTSCRHVRYFDRIVNHSNDLLQQYKLFVNASNSDVVCTATAEALAMGKFVICLKHPSNHFFSTFPNCFTYSSTAQFATAFAKAMGSQPVPLSRADAHRLSWKAATQRLYDAMRLPLHKQRTSKVDGALGSVHVLLSKIYPQPGKTIQRKHERERSKRGELNKRAAAAAAATGSRKSHGLAM